MPSRYLMQLSRVPRAYAGLFSAFLIYTTASISALQLPKALHPRQHVEFRKISGDRNGRISVAGPYWTEQSYTFPTCSPTQSTRVNMR